MPYAEPYVAKSVRAAVPHLEEHPELHEQAKQFVREELAHHVSHRAFNDVLCEHHPGLRPIERIMRRTYGWLEGRSARFNLAFAAGFETVAYNAARWVDKKMGTLFPRRGNYDQHAADLFLWHLAEEVEHKTVAFDAYRTLHEGERGSRRTYAAAMMLSAMLLALFTILGTLRLFWDHGRLFRPVAHWRMLTWTLGFTFDLFPAMAVSCTKSHHPSKLVDPSFYELWLRDHRAEPPLAA